MADELDGTQEVEEEQVTESEATEQPGEPEVDLFSMNDEEYMEYVNKGTPPEKPAQESEQPEPEPEPEDKKEQAEQPEDDKKEEQPQEAKEIDYKAFYDGVMAPFKSNGKEVTPTSLKDIRNLMQMGTDYTRKTQQIAPIRRIAETIRAAKINDEDLNNLINAYNGDKEAIKRILKKNNINSMDIDVESEDTNYRPVNNIASDKQVKFSEIIDEVQPNIQQIRTILTEKWDKASSDMIVERPELLRGINEEIQMGRFEMLQDVLENQRALGKFANMPDIMAYAYIAKAYDKYEQDRAQQKLSADKPKAEPAADKAKAAPVRKSPQQKAKKINDFDLAAMSDEEFMKIGNF